MSNALETLLRKLQEGTVSLAEAAQEIEGRTTVQLGEIARIDVDRTRRTGSPELVYGSGKEAPQIAAIMSAMESEGQGALATRVSAEKAARVIATLPQARYDEEAACLIIDPRERKRAGRGKIAVLCAGTSDLQIAREAEVTLEFFGHELVAHHDVGVAGLQRLLAILPELRTCEVIIAVAGMEGALPTVLAGLVSCPVIAVPSSVGYGVGSHGLAALVGMLSSCAPGLTVVNIDNGVGAAVAASRMNRKETDGL